MLYYEKDQKLFNMTMFIEVKWYVPTSLEFMLNNNREQATTTTRVRILVTDFIAVGRGLKLVD